MKKIWIILLAWMGVMTAEASLQPSENLVLGAARTDVYLPLLQGKNVALLSNHTGMIGDQHVLDLLLENNVQVTAIFSPEHGFRGTAREGEHVSSSVDEATGIPILSLYDGKSYYPSADAMKMFDVLIVDIQDVGLRFYTYYITMTRLMQACSEYNKHVIVFDRPNPNGYYVDGPILDMQYKSGVGYLPIPVVHGMTLGELALMINGEGWLKDGVKVELTVVPCLNYTHQTRYDLPVAPSPNLRNMLSIYLYPAMCLFEGTHVSLGRGTDLPFQCYGHPDMTDYPYEFTPSASVQKGNHCYGVNLSMMSEEDAQEIHFSLRYIIETYKVLNLGDDYFTPFFEKLVGVDYIRKMIMEGYSEQQIAEKWQDDVRQFIVQRKPYLLYPE